MRAAPKPDIPRLRTLLMAVGSLHVLHSKGGGMRYRV